MKQLKTVLENNEDFFDYAQRINPKRESLTPEKVRSFSGCQNYTDEEANGIIQSLEMLAVIIFENAETKSICIDNQQDVNLNDKLETKVISIPSPQTKKRAA
ncbi:hypothetical protein [Longitalea luteola]|uniref:hypothetical protein n=1 Tax=Longitalea luteola TaxID=2812563 RepID=UPI001A96FE4D|nr:hypothetical protein [Longitalea luteola]